MSDLELGQWLKRHVEEYHGKFTAFKGEKCIFFLAGFDYTFDLTDGVSLNDAVERYAATHPQQ